MQPQPVNIEDVSWAVRRPGLFRRAAGLIAIVSLTAGSLALGTNAAKLLPRTYGFPHPASSVGGPLLGLAFISLLAYVITLIAPPGPVAPDTKGGLCVSRGKLVLTGYSNETVAVDDIEAGWEEGHRRAVLRLRGGRELTIDAGSPAQVETLLTATGVEQRVARLPVGSALSAFPLGKTAGGIAVLFLVIMTIVASAALGAAVVSTSRGLMGGVELTRAALGLAWPAALLVGVLRVLAPRTAVVGKDGVAIQGLLSRRFLPYSEIDDATSDEEGVTLIRRDGMFRRVRLPHAQGGDGLFQRISAARKAHGDGTASIQVDRLDRRGRSIEEWLNELKGMTDRSASGYRSSAMLPEQLAAVAEDPAVSPERRIAAAASVAASGDADARARLRIAAEASADIEVRAALEQAAEGEIPEEALSRLTRST